MSDSGLRIIIITQGLSRIVKPLVRNTNVVGIIESAPRNYKYSFIKDFYKRMHAYWKNNNLNIFCKKENIPYFFMTGSDKILENWVNSIRPDVVLVYSMSQLLKNNIYSIPKYGSINIHPSLLPKYRGPNPWFWQYYNMEKKFGVTLHFIDKGEDTGDIIYQNELEVPLGMKSPAMHDIIIGELALEMVFKAFENLDNIPRRKQPKDSTTPRARNITEEEHGNIINWKNWNIERIWHILRGTELWLNAIEQPKGIYAGQRWITDEYEKCNMLGYDASKIYKEENRYFVACRDGKIYLSIKFSIKNFVLNLVGKK